MAKISKPTSEIDRLIELASDKPRSLTVDAVSLPEETPHALSIPEKDTRPAMWRILLQLRPLLPYLSRLLPLLESGLLGTTLTRGGSSALTHETNRFHEGMDEIANGHRELGALLRAQAGEIQRLQEQVESLAAAAELETERRQEMAEKLRLVVKTLTNWAIVAVVLLGALMGSVLFLILNRPN